MKKHDIVIPLAPCLGKLKDGSELRYVLRSLARHFKGEYEVTLIGPKKPDWYGGKWMEQKEGKLKTALKMAAEAFPEGFFWWYDDSVLIADQTPEECMVTPCRKKWGMVQTSWGRTLEKVRLRLVDEGVEPWDYSRPHGPYWFDGGMIAEAFADWPGMMNKFPFESWILSKRDWPRRFGVDAQYYGAWNHPPAGDKIFLNWCDAGFTAGMRKWLDERFVDPAREEGMMSEKKNVVKMEVHTLRYGTAWWVGHCRVTLNRWCKQHGYALRVWTDQNVPEGYPHPKFQEVDMLREFLAGDAEWLMYVDADVWVAPDAPAHPDLQSGFHVMPDAPSKIGRAWPRWVKKRFSGEEPRGWVYRNAGVWMCDRAAAEKVLKYAEIPPYKMGMMDQNQFNLWLYYAAREGMPVVDLSAGWNSFSGRMRKAAFQHIAGRRKAVKWERLKAAGLVWEMVDEENAAFDLAKYPLVWSDWMQMDDRHVQMLYRAACSEWRGTRVAVEIGSWKGRSTTALVEALNQGRLDHLHVIEVKPTRELREVLACARDASKVTLHTKPSWDLDLAAADFVFIDGDHRWPALADTLRAVTWGAKVICMHDSASFPRLQSCWGSWNAAKMLKQCPGRVYEEDCEDRAGEKTFRGFLVSRAVV